MAELAKGVDMAKLYELILDVEDASLEVVLFELWHEAMNSRRTMSYAITVLDNITRLVTGKDSTTR